MARYYKEDDPLGSTLCWQAVETPPGLPVLWAARHPETEGLTGCCFAPWCPERVRTVPALLSWTRFWQLPLHWPEEATPFQRQVWDAACRIPWGETRSYGWVARQIGHPGAVRAVGQALGRNPFAWRVPCHRVVRADGTLGGFAWGTMLKRRLLAWERQSVPPVGHDFAI